MDYFSIYQSYEEKYKNLTRKFIVISSPHINAPILDQLKEFYESVIKSKRAADNIKNLPDLLKILEKRSVLSYNNIEPLKYIAINIVKDPVLDNVIKEYEIQLQNQLQLPLFNVYKCKSGEYCEQKEAEACSSFNEIHSLCNESNDYDDRNLSSRNTESPIERLLDERNNDNHPTNSRALSSHLINLYSMNNIDNIENINTVKTVHYYFNFFHLRQYKKRHKFSNAIFFGTISGVVIVISIFLIIYLNSALGAESSTLSTAVASTSTTAPTSSSLHHAQPQSLSSDRTVQFTTVQPHSSRQSIPVTQGSSTSGPSELQLKVFQYLSENLGKSWRDLARFLGVRESEIDSIDSKTTHETRDKAYEALQIFNAKCDHREWQRKLIKSLNTIRRKDLAETVTDMIINNDKY